VSQNGECARGVCTAAGQVHCSTIDSRHCGSCTRPGGSALLHSAATVAGADHEAMNQAQPPSGRQRCDHAGGTNAQGLPRRDRLRPANRTRATARHSNSLLMPRAQAAKGAPGASHLYNFPARGRRYQFHKGRLPAVLQAHLTTQSYPAAAASVSSGSFGEIRLCVALALMPQDELFGTPGVERVQTRPGWPWPGQEFASRM